MTNRYHVVGPVGVTYHVGFYTEDGTFLKAHEFFSKDLAEATAYRLNSALDNGGRHGR